MRASTWNRITLVLSFAGLFVAGYLSLSALKGLEIPCGQTHGCDIVEQSGYSTIKGIPIALFGFGAYLTLAALAFLRSRATGDLWKKATLTGLGISGIGTLVSGYLVFTSFTEIHATCIWCISSAVIMMLSFFAHGFMSQSEEDAAPVNDSVLVGALCVLAVAGIGMRYMDMKKAVNDTKISAGKLPDKIDDMIPSTDAHFLGPGDAPVIVVEFGDLICPHCKDSYHQFSQIVEQSGGKVQFVFRQFPLLMNKEHQMALPAAAISEMAAEKNKFFDFLDEIYSTPDQSKITMPDLYLMGEKLGLSQDVIEKRLQDTKDKVYPLVQRDLDTGLNLGVKVTPTIIIGIRGQKPVSGTESEIHQLLGKPPFSNYVRGME